MEMKKKMKKGGNATSHKSDELKDLKKRGSTNRAPMMGTSFSGGRSRSRVHPFCNLQSRARTHAILVIGSCIT
jgi:hypothetical protein